MLDPIGPVLRCHAGNLGELSELDGGNALLGADTLRVRVIQGRARSGQARLQLVDPFSYRHLQTPCPAAWLGANLSTPRSRPPLAACAVSPPGRLRPCA